MGELREQVGNTNDAVKLMIGICDFSYGRYVLGVALTWKMNLNVLASATGCGAIDQHRITNSAGPESRYNRFVNQHNCVSPKFLHFAALEAWLSACRVDEFGGFMARSV